VHRGHQALVAAAVSHAERLGCSATALTFDPHPATFFRGIEPERFRLFDNDERDTLLRHYGIDQVLTMTFNESLAELSPADFVEQVLLQRLGAVAVVVGWDFTYGNDRAGTVDTLRESGLKYGFEVEIIARQRISETDVIFSSTALRDALKSGRIEDMNEMLGHHYFIAGQSADGAGRGGKVGIPTVNLYPTERLLPPRGVYATRLLVGGDEYASISNLGVRPTFESDGRLSLETMILDAFDGRDLHDCHVHVSILGFIRSEQTFDGPEALRAQIGKDVEKAKALHARFPSDSIHLTTQTSSTSLP
jgi:riboflavin kinase/FMN adenylyltransferase